MPSLLEGKVSPEVLAMWAKVQTWQLMALFVISWYFLSSLWSSLLYGLFTVAIASHIIGWALRKAFRENVTGKTVLITGGAMGLGRAMAKTFACANNRIVLWDINEEKLQEAATEIKKEIPGSVVHTFVVNVSDEPAVNEAVEKVFSAVGYVDVVVLNAGVVSGYPLLELPMDKMRRVFGVNVYHLFYTTKPFLAKMVKEGKGGHFVIMGSISGYAGVKGLSDYCASKSAAIAFAEALQQELAAYKNIFKTVVNPYYINTGMFLGATPLTFFPFLEEKEVAQEIYDAVSQKKELLVLPWLMHAVYFVKGLLPTFTYPWIDKILGTSESMKTFHGRRV